jgi:hypothetical protein
MFREEVAMPTTEELAAAAIYELAMQSRSPSQAPDQESSLPDRDSQSTAIPPTFRQAYENI